MTSNALKRNSILIITVLVAMAGLAIAQSPRTTSTQRQAASAEGPKVIAIKFHADWCGYCKAMGPVFEEMQAKYDQQPVLYVRLDQTREAGRRQAQYMARALGMGDIWAEYGGKTGFVLLVDGTTGEVIEKLTHDQSLKAMGASLREAVRNAS